MAWWISNSVSVRPRLSAACGFLTGAVFYTMSLSWIYTVMKVHGGLSVVEAAGVLSAIVLAGSLLFAVNAAGVTWIGRQGTTRACIAAPFLWVTHEFIRTHLPHIGFPWNLLGYAAGDSLLLLQLTTVTGIYGLSFLIVAWGAFLVRLGNKWRENRNLAAVFGLFVALTLLVPYTTSLADGWIPREQPQHIARLVQTNFPQSPFYPSDWMQAHAAELDELERISVSGAPQTSATAGPVIWPEVPAPFALQDANFVARAQRIARISGRPFLVGVVNWTPGPNGGLAPHNSAALLDSTGRQVFLYDKIHLVPFGEYVPLRRWLTFASKMTAEIGDFQPGSEYKVGTLPDSGRKFGVFICYEAIFPDEVRRFAANGAEVFINISNDGWFGRSAAPEQHLMMARVRAVESRRWLLRATNNGYTVSIDPYGRDAARLATDIRGALDAPYGYRSDLTIYARWGNWFAWLCVLVSLYFVLAALLRRRPA